MAVRIVSSPAMLSSPASIGTTTTAAERMSWMYSSCGTRPTRAFGGGAAGRARALAMRNGTSGSPAAASSRVS